MLCKNKQWELFCTVFHFEMQQFFNFPYNFKINPQTVYKSLKIWLINKIISSIWTHKHQTWTHNNSCRATANVYLRNIIKYFVGLVCYRAYICKIKENVVIHLISKKSLNNNIFKIIPNGGFNLKFGVYHLICDGRLILCLIDFFLETLNSQNLTEIF